LPPGQRVSRDGTAGYYIDFTSKATDARWPPAFMTGSQRPLYVAIIQWGLGCYERFLAEEDERWLAAALQVGEYLVDEQHRGGRLDGGWFHRAPFPHTFALRPPWLSGMAQGEGASLLIRLRSASGRETFSEAARRALGPLNVPTAAGGVRALLDGRPFPEEYPTDPPSHVLNGGIFALWGLRDVGAALDDAPASSGFDEGLDALVASLPKWDLGGWSRYDLFPHPVTNIASSAYHELHINQLRAMATIAPRPQLEATAARFEGYAASRRRHLHAFARKALFRAFVPRHRGLSRRLPWTRFVGRRDPFGR